MSGQEAARHLATHIASNSSDYQHLLPPPT
jgi:hypothetical protein